MKRTYAVLTALMFFFTLVVSSYRVSAQEVTLCEAVDIALTNNEKLKQYREKVQQKRYENRIATGNFLPSVSFQGSFNHLNDDLQIDLNPIRDVIIELQSSGMTQNADLYSLLQYGVPLTDEQLASYKSQYAGALDGSIPPFAEVLKDQDYYSASIVGMQPLYVGGKLRAAKRYAEAEEKASKEELRKTRNEVVRDTVEGYLLLALTERIVLVRADVLEGIQRHLADAETLLAEGLIARTDVLRAKVAAADAEHELEKAKNDRQLAAAALKHTLGVDTEIIIADVLEFAPVAEKRGDFLNRALKYQPVLNIIEQKKTGAEQKYKAEFSEFLPQVGLFGKYELYREDLSALEPGWAVGLNVSINLFNGFNKYNRVQSARHLQKEIEYLDEETRRQLDLLIEKSYLDMRNAEGRYLSLGASLELSEENVRQNELRYHTGLGTSLEVIDAHLAREKVEVEIAESLYRYFSAMENLYLTAGAPEDIIQIIQK